MGTFGGAQPIVTDGLVFAVDAANYQSYPGSGTTWNDMVGGNNGTLVNGPTFDEANGGSLVFDGTDDRVSTSFKITTNDFTDEVWVYTPNSFKSENQISSQYISGDGGRYILSINESTGHRIRYFLGGILGYSNEIIQPNTWYQIILSRENNTGYIYINGQLDKSVSAGTATLSQTTTYTLGQLSTLNNGYNWSGKIPTTHIYNRALTPSEITQNYNALKSRFGLT